MTPGSSRNFSKLSTQKSSGSRISVPSRSMNKTFFIFFQCFDQGVVLDRCTYCYPKTTIAKSDIAAVTDNDLFIQEKLVNFCGRIGLDEYKIRVRRVDHFDE